MKTLLLILLLCLSAFAQKLPKEIEVKYDKFNDKTEVMLVTSVPSPNRRYLQLIVTFEHPGSKITQSVDKFVFHFFEFCKSSYCFHADPEIIFLVDTKRMALADGSSITGSTLSDSAAYYVSRFEMETFCKAKRLEAKVGFYELVWDEKQLSQLRTILNLATVK